MRFLGIEGVSREKEDSEAESQLRSEKYPSVVRAAPSPSASASNSAGWLLVLSVSASSSARLLRIDVGDSFLETSSILPFLPLI